MLSVPLESNLTKGLDDNETAEGQPIYTIPCGWIAKPMAIRVYSENYLAFR
jgi:hypothetical protein